MARVRLAIVDDSSFVRRALARVLEAESRIHLVGSAASGEELLAHLAEWRPEVVTLDLSMPGIGGLATLSHVMATRPMPVIILSTHSAKDAPQTLEALARGAVDFIDKQQFSLVDFDALRTVLVERVLAVAGSARVAAAPAAAPAEQSRTTKPRPATAPAVAAFDLIVIGASTGGPPAIEKVLRGLDGRACPPIAVVQHMPLGFTRAFADRLDLHMGFDVHEAAHAQELIPGMVAVAPSGQHMRVRRDGGRLLALLGTQPEALPHRPSVDVLFESAARELGDRTLAVLLTGMGADGAEGMRALQAAGAWTIGQDETSCVVYGMPRAASRLGAVREELDLDLIAPRILELIHDPNLPMSTM